MAAEEWGQSSFIEQRLKKEFYRFTFFQAIAIIERHCEGKKPLGEALRPLEEPVRFQVSPGFSFPPSDIAGIRFDEEESRFYLNVAFMGLIGPSGILPRWYNELAQERNRSKDFSLTEFLDLFHHRLNTLFYLAWKKSHLTAHYRPGVVDRFSRYFSSFVGLGADKGSSPADLGIESLLGFSGLLSRQIPSSAAIESALSHYSGQKAVVQQFIERVIALPPEDLTKIGMANSELGVSALCGAQVWENMSKFRIDLGPMDTVSFSRFLPGGGMLRSMFSLVRFMVGIEYEFEIRIILKRDQVTPCRLGGGGSGFSPMLGWSSWIKAPDAVLEEDPSVTFQDFDTGAVTAA
ncbi:MAG TPA: type VI secretion system baseplate subunit TssG [Desulfuromonadales bacterium]|nr:type VI secretion system baseplate subunit TssG [Desulfuromonadales bacterium]